MDQNAWEKHWQELYSEIYIVGEPEMRNWKKPTDQHLDRIESKIGVRLPSSYRGFVKVFGPGRLALSFAIFAPGYRGADVVDLLSNNKWQDVEARNRQDSDRIRRSVAFADIGYEYFIWDSNELTSPDSLEYRIYQMPKFANQPLIEITDSFKSFVEEFCLGGKYLALIGGQFDETWVDENDGEVRSIRCFEPIGGEPRSSM